MRPAILSRKEVVFVFGRNSAGCIKLMMFTRGHFCKNMVCKDNMYAWKLTTSGSVFVERSSSMSVRVPTVTIGVTFFKTSVMSSLKTATTVSAPGKKTSAPIGVFFSMSGRALMVFCAVFRSWFVAMIRWIN